MKRSASCLVAVACAFGLGGCVKVSSTAQVKGDASGTLKLSFAVKEEAIEVLKTLLDQAVESSGDGPAHQAREVFDRFQEGFEAPRIAQKLKELGLEVTSAQKTEKEGWQTIEVEATFTDVNACIQKVAQEASRTAPLGGGIPKPDIGLLIPRFYKTDRAGVGKLVLLPPLTEAVGPLREQIDEIEEAGQEERDMLQQFIDMQKSMLFLDELRLELRFELPGPVVATQGCRKTGPQGVAWSMTGSAISVDGLRNYFGLKDGAWVTFEIPEGCKIAFQDAEVKKSPAPEKKEDGGKKGALKIGGDKQR